METKPIFCPACKNEMIFLAHSETDCPSPIYWCQGCGSLKYLNEGEERITRTGETWKKILSEENELGG